MASLSCTGSTDSSLTFTISGLQYPANQYTQFQINLFQGGVKVREVTWSSASTGTSTSYTISSLSSSTSYSADAYANYNNTNYSVGSTSGTTNAPPPPPITVSPPTGISIIVDPDGNNPLKVRVSFTKGANAYYTNIDASWGAYAVDYLTSNTSMDIVCPSYNTQYWLKFQGESTASSGSYQSSWTGAYYFTTGKNKPTPFSWATAKTKGGVFSVTASEWNSFTSKINEFRSYKGLSSYLFSTAVSGGTFTATVYNQAVSAISPMSPPIPVPSARSSGDSILASYLNDIVSSLNSIT